MPYPPIEKERVVDECEEDNPMANPKKYKIITLSTRTFDYFHPAEFSKQFNKLKGWTFDGVVVSPEPLNIDYLLEFRFMK